MGFFALTEPNVGSDASGVQTTATLQGDSWVLNGTKMFITNGAQADIGIVFAKTEKAMERAASLLFWWKRTNRPLRPGRLRRWVCTVVPRRNWFLKIAGFPGKMCWAK
jgi:alkylation response protein AidB-like acyl-CoA dehydrogenase